MGTETTFRRKMLRAVALTALVLGTVAVAVDMGMIVMVRTRLQSEADASAVTAAIALADPDHTQPPARDAVVEVGYWDAASRTFTPTSGRQNAVRATAQGWGPFFFARWIGRQAFVARASAVAMTRPPKHRPELSALAAAGDPHIVQ